MEENREWNTKRQKVWSSLGVDHSGEGRSEEHQIEIISSQKPSIKEKRIYGSNEWNDILKIDIDKAMLIDNLKQYIGYNRTEIFLIIFAPCQGFLALANAAMKVNYNPDADKTSDK